METFWLVGRKDMAEANDSMVCKFLPRKKKPGDKKKKPPKKKKGIRESVVTLKTEGSDSPMAKSTVTLKADIDSRPSSRKNSLSGLIAHTLGKLVGGPSSPGHLNKSAPGSKRNSFESSVTALMQNLPIMLGTSRQNEKDSAVRDHGDTAKVINSPISTEITTESEVRNLGPNVQNSVHISISGDDKEQTSLDGSLHNGNEHRIHTNDPPKIIEPKSHSTLPPISSQIVRNSGNESIVNDIITDLVYQKDSESKPHLSNPNYAEISTTEVMQYNGSDDRDAFPEGLILNQNFMVENSGKGSDIEAINSSSQPRMALEDITQQQVKRPDPIQLPFVPEFIYEEEDVQAKESGDVLSKNTNYSNNSTEINGQENDRIDPEAGTLVSNQELTVKDNRNLPLIEVAEQKVVSNNKTGPSTKTSKLTSSLTKVAPKKSIGGLYSYNYSLQQETPPSAQVHLGESNVKGENKSTGLQQEKRDHFVLDMADSSIA